ncbi:MAG: ATP-dependent DNA ligase [Coprothermobacterota bacterium]|nr:ATP-dependent DNA ligase [Coprothermobacterota bacterium]
MKEWARTLESLEKTKSTSSKVELVASYLKSGDPEELDLKARFLSGQALPLESPDPLNVGWSLILEALSEIQALEPGWESVYREYGDLGEAVFRVLGEKGWKESGPPVSLRELGATFEQVATIKGKSSRQRKKLALLNLLPRLSPVEVKFFLRLIFGDLRVGLKENLVEVAISRAFSVSLPAIRKANLLLSDIGQVACMAKKKTVEQAALIPGRPFKFMLAETVLSSGELFLKDYREYLAEDKYDGIRAQLHFSSGVMRLFSRNLEEISRHFLEIAQSMTGFPHEVILDGEIVAFKDLVLPFAMLQKRLHRVKPEKVQEEIPVSYFVFDLLYLDGRSLLYQPLSERRRLLSSLSLPKPIRIAHQVKVRNAEEMEEAFRKSRTRGNEGLVLKDPKSPYSPGKRGRQWLKYKKELSTLDCVVVKVEWGHGKRAGLLSDFTFAVRDRHGALLTIGKAFSGLTDSEIEHLTSWFREHALKDEGWGLLVEPKIIVEVAFNGIQRSSRHKSGFALRFPRIKRIREDKTVEEISTLEDAERIYMEGGR